MPTAQSPCRCVSRSACWSRLFMAMSCATRAYQTSTSSSVAIVRLRGPGLYRWSVSLLTACLVMKLTRLGRVSQDSASSAGLKDKYFSLSPSNQSWRSRALHNAGSCDGQPFLISRRIARSSGVSSPGKGMTAVGAMLISGGLDPGVGECEVFGVQLDADVAPPVLLGHDARGAGARKWIKNGAGDGVARVAG